VPVEPLEATAPALAEDDVTDHIGLRHALRARLATVEGSADLIEDYLLAVDEMTSNEDLSHGGMGLWLARQLCDHVAIRREAAGVSVRLTVAWA
jgi:hypothetical protein